MLDLAKGARTDKAVQKSKAAQMSKTAQPKENKTGRFKGFLDLEVEIKRLKEMLATEIRLKEFLLQDVDVISLFPIQNKDEVSSKKAANHATDPSLVRGFIDSYDTELSGSLRNDHKELLFIYKEVIKNAEAKKFSLVSVHLETFQRLLTQHYHKADEHLYTYLDALVRCKYPKREKAFSLLNREMKKISISIFYSLSEAMEIQLSNDTYYCFMCSFTRLGKQLKKRINSESTLLLNMYEESKSIHCDNCGGV